MTRVIPKLLAALAALLISFPVVAGSNNPPFPAPLQAAFDRAKNSMMSDPAAVLSNVEQVERLANDLTDEHQRALALATGHWLAGEANLRRNAPDRAEPLLAEGLRLIESIKGPIKLRGDLLMSQGALYMQRDDAARALANFQKAYRVFGEVREPRSQAIALQNIGALYSGANDGHRAEQYYLQAAEIYSGDPSLSLALHNSRGNVLLVLERYAEAEEEYRAALGFARQLHKPLLEGRILGNLARNQSEAREFDAAERTLSQALAITKGADAQGFRQQLLATAARVASGRGDFRRAKRLITQAFVGVDTTRTSLAFREAHLYAYLIFERTGDTGLALKHLEALKRLSDEAAKVATTNNAALMSARFDYANQQASIERLKKEEAERTAAFQRTLFLSIGAATLVVIAALAWGLLSIRRSRNKVRASNVILEQTNVALEKALKAKTEFLATTSHEIRTPLNGILGMTQVMLSDQKLDAATRDRIGIVHGAGVTMRSLVDDILDVAKIETGNLTVEAVPMNLPATLREVTRMWEEQARAKGLEFRLDLDHAPSWIVGDAGRLRQIVFNLLSNAIKFTETGSVSVRAFAEGEGEASRLKLSITDSGIGIPAEKAEEIFESFKQADSGTTRKFGGTGLGLTICRNLARAMGGDVLVESRTDEGSTFTIDLPLILADAPAEEAIAHRSGTMLILDRSPITRAMLKTLFEPRVGALRFVSTPDEALAALAEPGIESLLIDGATLKAGDGDHLAALSALAEAAMACGAGSALLSQKLEETERASLLATCVGQVIEKPVSGASLIEAIIPAAKQNSDKLIAGALVSRAA